MWSISIIDKTDTLLSFMDPLVFVPLFDLVVSLAAAAQVLFTLRGWMDGWMVRLAYVAAVAASKK
jgi:hypothetical protein